MFKQVTFKPKGMNRDLSKTSFNKEYAYEIKNMRLTVLEDGTLGSITNEIGPGELNVKSKDGQDTFGISGIPLGQAVIDNVYVLFTHLEDVDWEGKTTVTDYIYKIWQDNDTLKGEILYYGDLNFNLNYPIETLSYYENNKVRKVYWTDNYNQPRLINIDKDYKETVTDNLGNISNRYDSTVFDFVPTLKLQEEVVIEKINASDGQFPAGTVQYSFTYFDLYGHESNIFYTSPLYYTSFLDRGGSGEEKVGNAFKITIKGVDTKFDYIRIYCTIRTSIDSNVLTRKVKDVKLKPNGNLIDSIVIIDDGIIGEDADEYSLFFRGGTPITVKTLNQKDNTLFVGNIKEYTPVLSAELITNIQTAYSDTIKYKDIEVTYKYTTNKTEDGKVLSYIRTDTKTLELPELNSYYPWNNSLYYNNGVITTFKTGEVYRFGLQFQHKTGKWSDVVWIEDCKNTIIRNQDFADNVATHDTKLHKTIAYLDSSAIKNEALMTVSDLLEKEGYIKARPVIVYPSLADRNVLCQGILCPTVFNVNDRKTNAPFAQSSWFIRPNLPENLGTTKEDLQNNKPLKGSFPEFRHYYPLPANSQRNAEIQCNDVAPNTPCIASTSDTFEVASNKFVSYFKDNFYVDQSIVTFHSPDIEFDDNLKNVDFSLFKMRIVGVVPITAHSSDIDITAGSTLGLYNKDTLGTGFFKYTPKACTTLNSGIDIAADPSRALLSGIYWIDGVARHKNEKVGTDYISITANQRAYVIYPWHREISLNNDINYATYQASAGIKHKRISNFYSSYDSLYLDESSYYNIDINDAKLFDSNEITLVKLHSPIVDEEDIVYYGNVDRVITPSVDKVPNTYSLGVRDKSDGYDIMISDVNVGEDGSDAQTAFTGDYITLKSKWLESVGTPVYKVNDPIHIKYKSTPHAVLSTKGSKIGSNYVVNILPCIAKEDGTLINSAVMNRTFNSSCFWDNKIISISQGEIRSKWGTTITSTQSADSIVTNSELTPNPDAVTVKKNRTLQYGFLWLAELYREDVNNRFGGSDTNALAQNNWLVAGDSIVLKNSNNNYTLNNVIWSTGDTFYQRYDHIKTYPFTTEDANSVSEVISFMCETRVNLDGRYDKNRLYYNNLIITPEKFNLMNEIYNQKDTYFTYHTIDHTKNNITEYSNTISWGNTKINGTDTDSWTNINLAASLELDGNLGPVNSIKKYNNDIIIFQDKGVSIISYNENVQISSTSGVPIEILNSGKVTGKRYISNTLGSVNKWSVCETPMGIVFIDDNAKNIYIYDGQIKNLSDVKGFNSWVREHSNLKEWNPVTFDNYVTYYDNINNEILFIGKDDCLVYSLKIAEFTSFYSYNNVPYFFNLYDKGIFLHKDWNIAVGAWSLWEEHAGIYNDFFKKPVPYSIEVIANEEPTKDKIFNNIEYNADTWEGKELSNITFDTIECYNDYQKGVTSLSTKKYKPSNLKRKFRTWRIQVPRDNVFKQDRIRDTWMGLKLSHTSLDNAKMLLHDITVTYNSN